MPHRSHYPVGHFLQRQKIALSHRYDGYRSKSKQLAGFINGMDDARWNNIMELYRDITNNQSTPPDFLEGADGELGAFEEKMPLSGDIVRAVRSALKTNAVLKGWRGVVPDVLGAPHKPIGNEYDIDWEPRDGRQRRYSS